MLSFALMPKYLKEIFSHVPTVAFKLVSWSELWQETKDVLKNYNAEILNEDLYAFLKEKLQGKILPPQSESTPGGVCPEFALELYFTQLKNPYGVFLDLRSSRFKIGLQEEYTFVPNFLQYKFSESFKKSLIKLYTGFYGKEDDKFKSGLDELGLTKNLSFEKKEELSSMFYSHFGGSSVTETEFDLKAFNNSFFKIFKFFVDNKIKLSADFIYLGVYLITLYMHMDKTGPINVKRIFFNVFPED